MASNFICPFCMNEHRLSINNCSEKGKNIPVSFKNAIKDGAPHIFIATIGYRTHGKTCFLSSLFYSLYALPHEWENFSFIPLNQESLSNVNDNINILRKGHLPPATPVMFPIPSVLLLQKMPLYKKQSKFLSKFFDFDKKMIRENLLLTFYDIGGETFNDEKLVNHNLKILKHVGNLLVLIDLPKLVKDSQVDGVPPEVKMQSLFATIYNSLNAMNLKKKKAITVCFTKSDLMTGNSIYGPLSEWEEDEFPDEIPPIDSLPYYVEDTKQFSDRIAEYIKKEYPAFYYGLENNFASVNFSTFSALGSAPTENELATLSPKRVLDPIVWSLVEDKYL